MAAAAQPDPTPASPLATADAAPAAAGSADQEAAFPRVDDTGLSDADAELLYRVRDAIDRYEPIRISGSPIQVALVQGTIALRGRARSAPLKLIAETLARAAAGSHPISSELVSDPDLSIAVATALAMDPRTNLAPVHVQCLLGAILLAGEVPTAEMATVAPEIARGVPGVREVDSQLVAAPAPAAPSASEAKAEAGATSKPTADTAVTSEPRLEPHGQTQDRDKVTRPENGERVPIADT
jgi:osmotically-inducible protein OsmY